MQLAKFGGRFFRCLRLLLVCWASGCLGVIRVAILSTPARGPHAAEHRRHSRRARSEHGRPPVPTRLRPGRGRVFKCTKGCSDFHSFFLLLREARHAGGSGIIANGGGKVAASRAVRSRAHGARVQRADPPAAHHGLPAGGGGSTVSANGYLGGVAGLDACCKWAGGRVAPWWDLGDPLPDPLARPPSLRSRAGEVLVVRAPYAVGQSLPLRSRVPRRGPGRSPSPAAGGGDRIGAVQGGYGSNSIAAGVYSSFAARNESRRPRGWLIIATGGEKSEQSN